MLFDLPLEQVAVMSLKGGDGTSLKEEDRKNTSSGVRVFTSKPGLSPLNKTPPMSLNLVEFRYLGLAHQAVDNLRAPQHNARHTAGTQ